MSAQNSDAIAGKNRFQTAPELAFQARLTNMIESTGKRTTEGVEFTKKGPDRRPQRITPRSRALCES